MVLTQLNKRSGKTENQSIVKHFVKAQERLPLAKLSGLSNDGPIQTSIEQDNASN
jgi:hypothetical protein